MRREPANKLRYHAIEATLSAKPSHHALLPSPTSTPCSNAISSYATTLSNLVCNAFRFLSARAAGVSSFLPTHEPALSPTHPPPRSPPAHAATRFPILPRLREIGLPRKRSLEVPSLASNSHLSLPALDLGTVLPRADLLNRSLCVASLCFVVHAEIDSFCWSSAAAAPVNQWTSPRCA